MSQVTLSAVRVSKFSADNSLLSPQIVAGLKTIAFLARIYTTSRQAYVKARNHCYRYDSPEADKCDSLYEACKRHRKAIRSSIDALSEVLRASGGPGLSDGLLFTIPPDRAVCEIMLANEIAKHLTDWADDGDDSQYVAFKQASRASTGQSVIEYRPDSPMRQRGVLEGVRGTTASVRHFADDGHVFKTPLENLRLVPEPLYGTWKFVRDERVAIAAEVLSLLEA